MIKILLTIMALGGMASGFAQSSFLEYQRTNTRASIAFKLKEDTLKKQFAKANIAWPPKQVYIRSFKYDSQLEVWVRNDEKAPFTLFKTYKICALSGSLGPKRMEGDYQVPEGFYYINLFKPESVYHLSLSINYPNMADMLLSDSLRPGGDIYIHGSCVTVGCIPIMDSQIEELYVLASYAKENNEDFIPVHIFPIRYDRLKSLEYLVKTIKANPSYEPFALKLKEVFDTFEKTKKIPLIAVNKKGEYVIL